MQLYGYWKRTARTYVPRVRNSTAELFTFGTIAEVSSIKVQWWSLALSQQPAWSLLRLPSGKFKYSEMSLYSNKKKESLVCSFYCDVIIRERKSGNERVWLKNRFLRLIDWTMNILCCFIKKITIILQPFYYFLFVRHW